MLLTALSYFGFMMYSAITYHRGIIHVPLHRYFEYLPPVYKMIETPTLWFIRPFIDLLSFIRISIGGYLAFCLTYIMFLRIMFNVESPPTYQDDTYYIVAGMEEEAERKRHRRLDFLAFIIYIAIVSILNFTLSIINPDNDTMNFAMSVFYPIAILSWYSPILILITGYFYYTVGIFACLIGYAGMRRHQLTGRLR